MHCHSRIPLIGVISSAARRHACRGLANRRAFVLVLATASFVSFLHTPGRAQTPEPHVAACTLANPPNTLWSLAQCCATDLKSNPSCLYDDKTNTFVIVKDNNPKKTIAYLIIPSTTKVTGIEDKQIFSKPFVNFWDDGWKELKYVLKKPTGRFTGLAINSENGRDQNQLHIHISCVSPQVAQTLASNDTNIGTDPKKPWKQLVLGTHNNKYEALKVKLLTDTNSPFNLITDIPGAVNHMKDQSIAVVELKTPDEYYVLNTYYDPVSKNPGTAEELLDQNCNQPIK